MTLNTEIAIIDPAPIKEVFDYCRKLIGATEEYTYFDKESSCDEGVMQLWMNPGQGLPGWLMLNYRNDAPLRTKDQEYSYEFCDVGEDPYFIGPACSFEIQLDTAYGYRDEKGWNCGDLHAWFVGTLGVWLRDKNIRFQWKNEFTGEWHSDNNFRALAELGVGGFEAVHFWDIVKKAIGIENG